MMVVKRERREKRQFFEGNVRSEAVIKSLKQA